VLRLAQAICILSLALSQAWGGSLVLTGLSRIGGESRAFFSDGTASGSFSLMPGEDREGVRLLSVEFRERWALVADCTGTNRIVFATAVPAQVAPTVPGHPDGMLPPGRTLHRLPGTAAPNPLPTAAEEPGSASMAEISLPPPQAGASEVAPENGNSGSAVSAATGSPVVTPALPRRATADELFKSRNGYAAWEDLLRQRHQAELLAASPVANENP
jgi:hypothetical protein